MATKQEVMKMTRAEVIAFIENEDLDIRPENFERVADLKLAVAAEMTRLSSPTEVAKDEAMKSELPDNHSRFEVALPGNQTRIVVALSGSHGDAIAKYNEMMGILSTQHQHIVSEL